MMNNLTIDTFFNGQIKVLQPKSGYRFSIDAVLLANYITTKPGDVVLDVGTGCGIIPVITAYRNPGAVIIGLEIQQALADIAKTNVTENHMEDRITIKCGDLKDISPSMLKAPVDMVVSNPPYRKIDTGRINPNRQRAIARHEIKASIADVISAANKMLKTRGKFCVVYPAVRMIDLLVSMREWKIEPKKIIFIHSKRDTEAILILVEGIKNGRPGLKTAPPLFIYEQNGRYTKAVEAMFSSRHRA